jgi:hypothetical protein
MDPRSAQARIPQCRQAGDGRLIEAFAWIFPAIAGAGTLYFFGSMLAVRIAGAADRRWAESAQVPYYSAFGEGVVGRMHMRSPFAHLTATSSEMRLVFMWRRYVLPRSSITHLGPWNVLWVGLRIEHAVDRYPPLVYFHPRDIRSMYAELESLGYST